MRILPIHFPVSPLTQQQRAVLVMNALEAQRRKRMRHLLPAPVLRAVYPSLLAWDWEIENPAKWNVWMSLNSGASWSLLEDNWAWGSARQFAPDGGSQLYFIVGVDANGAEITERSNSVVPDNAYPAPVLAPRFPSLAVWQWAYPDPARWNAYRQTNGVGPFEFDDWVAGTAREYAPDGGQHPMLIVGVDAGGNEITERSNAVVPDSASSLGNGLVAYWDGDSEYDEVGARENTGTSEDCYFGLGVSLPDETIGVGYVAASAGDHFYSEDMLFDDYTGRTTNCWVYLDAGDVMSLMSEWTHGQSSGNTVGQSFEFSPNYWTRLTHTYWDDDGEGSWAVETLEEEVYLPWDEWLMVTMITSTTELAVYVNGTLATVLEKTYPTGHNTAEPEAFFWNGRDHYGNLGNPCNLVFMGVWDRELTGAEITELYNGGDGLAYASL